VASSLLPSSTDSQNLDSPSTNFPLTSRNQPWPPEHLEFLLEHWDHRPASWIAKKLGISRSAVCGKIQRLGLVGKQEHQWSEAKFRPAAIEKRVRDRTMEIEKARQERLAMRAAASEQPPPEFLCIEFMDLKPRHCRWPSEAYPTTYCGQRRTDCSSYCEHHEARAFTTQRRREIVASWR
jgi:hypothetical protein